MASEKNVINKTPHHGQSATIPRWCSQPKIVLRRRRLQTVRLGGKKPRRGHLLARLLRRVRLRWLKLKYFKMLKKLKEYFKCLIKDLIEAGATVESFQKRLLLDTSFAIPVMGMSFNTFPNSHALGTPSRF